MWTGGPEHPPPWELIRWTIAERFGWTLDAVDSLSMADYHELIQVDDGKAKAARKGEEVK